MSTEGVSADEVTAFVEKAAVQPQGESFVLCLFVVGSTPRSARTIARVKRLCEEHLAGRFELEIVELRQQSGRTAPDEVIAIPTLLRRLPLPVRRISGEIADDDRILTLLDPTDRSGSSSE